MVISSRTPEGQHNHCPVCGADLRLEPTRPPGDAPCPNCGQLLWFPDETPDRAHLVTRFRDLIKPLSTDLVVHALLPRRGVRVVIDLEGVPFASSSDLARLVELKKSIEAVWGRVRLRNLHPDWVDVFRLTRLDWVFDVEG